MGLMRDLREFLVPEKETYRLMKGGTRYTISKKGDRSFLKVNGVIYSELDRKSIYLHSYHDYFLPLPLMYDKPKILMLGLGAGTIPFHLSKLYAGRFSMDVVELDRGYVGLTKRFLPDSKMNFKIVIGDGAKFVERKKNKYDIIIQDVYDDGSRIPKQFLDRRFIGAAHDALKDDGILAINYAPNLFYLPVYLHRLKKSFRHVYRMSHISFANYILLCSKEFDKKQIVKSVESKMRIDEDNRFLLKAYRSMR